MADIIPAPHNYKFKIHQTNLNWDNHISNILVKANRTLGFVRRNLSNCPEEIKKHAYYALVRPHLEYASSVWDPHVQKQINDIEAVQRRAARFAKRCYDRTVNSYNYVGRFRMAHPATKTEGSKTNNNVQNCERPYELRTPALCQVQSTANEAVPSEEIYISRQ